MDAHTHCLRENQRLIYSLALHELASPPQGVYFCAGIHPWQAEGWEQSQSLVEHLSVHPLCLGIGETGLDRLHPHWEAQLKSLHWHWDLSEKVRKPLILHVVKASSDILTLLKGRRSSVPHMWHDFHGPLDVVEKILRLHSESYFSFSPRFIHTPKFQQLWQTVPLHLRLIESDEDVKSYPELLQLVESEHEQLSKNFHTLFSI
jgi:TatD DNase family protein